MQRRGVWEIRVALTGLAIVSAVALAEVPAAPSPSTAPALEPAPGIAAVASNTPSTAAPDAPSPAALRFGKQCGGCHRIGEGDNAGPDLLGVLQRRDKAWLTGFIRGPGTFIDRGDPIANDLFKKFKNVRMPDQPLTDEELAALFEYLADCTTKGGCKLALGKIRPATEATPQEIAFGRELFEGTRALTAGGPACISCHNVRGIGLVGGGTLAKDLTFAHARLGDAGLDAALQSTPFPLMKDVFGAKRALTQAEAFQLKAYLWDASRDGSQPRADVNFVYAGILGTFLSLGLIGMVWAGRMRGHTRRNVINRTKRGTK